MLFVINALSLKPPFSRFFLEYAGYFKNNKKKIQNRLMYLHRKLEKILKEALEQFPACLITGLNHL